jgi:predicted Ser/Thr protein kinase
MKDTVQPWKRIYKAGDAYMFAENEYAELWDVRPHGEPGDADNRVIKAIPADMKYRDQEQYRDLCEDLWAEAWIQNRVYEAAGCAPKVYYRGDCWFSMTEVLGREMYWHAWDNIDGWLTAVDGVVEITRRISEIGIVHGDLHGGNIIATENGVVLIDFGESYKTDPQQAAQENLQHLDSYLLIWLRHVGDVINKRPPQKVERLFLEVEKLVMSSAPAFEVFDQVIERFRVAGYEPWTVC